MAAFALAAAVLVPTVARAGMFSFVSGLFQDGGEETPAVIPNNSQNMAVLAASPSPNQSEGGADVAIVDGTTLAAHDGPQSSEDRDTPHRPGSDQISVYVVRDGDTLSGIAQMFDVTVNTILWTNDLDSKTVRPGQVLIILPVSGVQYTVKKGDTIASIAKATGGDATEIANYNEIDDNSQLAAGTTLIIPNGEAPAVASVPSTAKKSGSSSSSSSSSSKKSSTPLIASEIGGTHAAPMAAASGATGDTTGYYMRPLKGGIKTQGIHGYNAVDIGTPVGTTIYAAASGDVIVSKDSGWNGGYGNYVVISHPNGTQTLYAHLSSTIVVAGQHVVQGQVIGYSGSTGESTGPHLHFEVRGAPNPF
jgi:LysM repeat protein